MIYLVQNKTQTKFAYDLLSSEPTLGADTETTGLDPFTSRVLLIQLGTSEHQFVFDIAKIPLDSLKLIFEILESPEIVKIFQNGKFDYKMLKQNFGITVRNLADTMIAEQLLTKGIKKKGFGLEELTQKYRAGKLYKATRKEFQEMKFGDKFSEEAIIYAAEDVRVLPFIYHEQLKLADEKGMTSLLELENKVVPVMGELELNGIFLDKQKWKDLEQLAIKEREKAELALQKHFEPFYPKNLFGKLDLNYDSWQQIKPGLEKVLGHEIESTNEKYLAQFDHQVIDDLRKYREAAKAISTYGKVFLKYIHPETKRIHAEYLQLGTDSGRMSCANPNMQNIPHEQKYRTPFCAQKKEWKIISADFSSQDT
jgi:DNA polymerase-1